MTIMIQSGDENFQALLSEYAAPIEDDGFSETVLRMASDRETRLKLLKFGFLATGCFFGGMIAATQLKSMLRFAADVTLPHQPLWTLLIAVIFAFVVWATLDNKDAGFL